VFGVADDRWGEAVAALVITMDGSEVTADGLCPYCGNSSLEWRTLSGGARLYSSTTVHRDFGMAPSIPLPYVSAIVSPVEDDDVRFVTRLLFDDTSSLALGTPLRVRFVREDGLDKPLFELA
jgi:uncharacterized OB-fold protein